MGPSRQPPLNPRVKAAVRCLDQSDLSPWRQAEPSPLFRRGIDEFNQRQFFEQHETMETLWRAEPALVRYLYQGILQVGVGFLHLSRGNYHGAVVKLASGLALLQPFEPACLGVDVAGLRRQSDVCLRAVLELGPERLDRFDLSLIPLIRPQ